MEDLTPREIVAELDKYIIGQAKAKRAVAIALRNRYRRRRLADDLRDEVIPKNILAKEIAGILEDQQLTQTEAAYIMRDAPSQISLVVTGKLRGFSTERLIRMLARLGRDIDIVIRPAKGKTGKVAVVRK